MVFSPAIGRCTKSRVSLAASKRGSDTFGEPLATQKLFLGNGLYPLHQLLELIRKGRFVATHGALEEGCQV